MEIIDVDNQQNVLQISEKKKVENKKRLYYIITKLLFYYLNKTASMKI